MRVAVIADDLTGALDTASPFACRGARTLCFTEPDGVGPEAAAEAEVISVSTNSRHLPSDEAAQVVRAAAERIRPLKPDIVLKKIDSRLKGNVASESAAAVSVFGFKRLLVVPAAPDIGRLVEGGLVTGHGIATPISVQDRFAQGDCPFEVPDAGSPAALGYLARGYLQDREVLPVCSRGFAVALAKDLYPAETRTDLHAKSPILVAIGSRDAVTTAQRQALCAKVGFVCIEAVNGLVPDNLSPSDCLLLYCEGDTVQPAEKVARRFADGVCKLAGVMNPKTLLCSGGDTALAVLSRLGQSVLRVVGEAAPGLPISMARLAGHDVGFISKSGGFGNVSTLLDIFAKSTGPGRPNLKN